MDWLYYLLEANLYLLIFYGFYRLFLQNETFYNSNRYFLLLSSITAFTLPILQLGFLKPTPIIDNILFPPPIPYGEEIVTAIPTTTPIVETFNFTDYLYPIYLFIVLCFALKLIFSLSKIVSIWLKAKKAKTGNVTLIELNEQTTAFSFFNLLFIHPHLAEKETVLNHEMVHIKQKHSLDILFFEVLQMICWFNPIIYFIKKDIKLLHEYIADELSTNSGLQKHEYAMFLIENSFGIIPTPLTNQIFNQSILKRRINMLNKKRTANWARLRLLMTLPLVGGMLCASTMAFTKDYGYVDLLPEKSKAIVPIQENPTVKTVKKDQIKFPPPKESIAFFSPKKYDKSTKKHISLENRLIIINGKETPYKNDFFGVRDADKIVTLKSADAIKKYGDKAKYGAVEVTGKNIKILNTPVDQIKFPPPIVRKDKNKSSIPFTRIGKTHFYSAPGTDIYGKPSTVETRYVVINGKKVEDFSSFYGVTNATSVVVLNSDQAVNKYGSTANHGVIEITGDNLTYVKSAADGPPPPIEDQVKFPPPIVKPDRKNVKRPPAVEPPPLGYKPKTDQIKFPPPIVKPDGKNVKRLPAVEPPPPTYKPKTDQIKFPPPVVMSEKKTTNAVEVVHHDELNKANNDKLKFEIPEGAIAKIEIQAPGRVVYKNTNYQNDWDAKDEPSGNYSVSIGFFKNGKLLGGKNIQLTVK